MRPNRLRDLLRADKPSIGTHLHSTWPGHTEVIGHAGTFDYIEYHCSYAPFDLYALENLGRAINQFPNFTAMIKVDQEPRTFLATRAIGSGIPNILFADTRTVADARECVRAVRAEAPGLGGINGVGMRWDVGYLLEGGTPAWVQSLEDAVVALMIEKKEAVEDLEAILDVPGIDMVQFGPGDYSLSVGLAGQFTHPAVLEAERYTIETALRKGIAPRAELIDSTGAERHLELGVKHFCIGTDMTTLYDWSKEHGGRMREMLGST